MDSDILRLLDDTKELLGRFPNKKQTVAKSDKPYPYSSPVRKTIVISFLINHDWPYAPSELTHVYDPEECLRISAEFAEPNIILHGHPEGIPCAAPHFCHHNGYRPTTTDSPTFVQQFHMKWKELYSVSQFVMSEPSCTITVGSLFGEKE